MNTFPTNGKYVEALQHTDVCFQDKELKGGQVELTPLGMPRAISGNFASVFSITGASGKRYAVKCFTRQVAGQHKRYKAIHDSLASLDRTWKVGFEYIPQGVLVEGKWYAILRMEWVQNSKTLIPWLEQNLGNPDRIFKVANEFAACVKDLHQAGIAHGDLQHGNLLIDNEQRLRLIDYDGMYVPSIKDLGSNEDGLANYQHPGRAGHFAPDLDRFSAWLIYGSLISLAAYPTLWLTNHRDGDEKLIFGKDDFQPPFARIEELKARDASLAEVADVLIQGLRSSDSLGGVPEFDPKRIPLPSRSVDSSGDLSDWWKGLGADHTGTASTPDDTADTTRLGAGWLRSHATPLPPVEVVRPSLASTLTRFAIMAGAIPAAAGTAMVTNELIGIVVLLTWMILAAVGIWTLWCRSDVALARTAARRTAKSAVRQVADHKAALEKSHSARAALAGDEQRALQKLEKERSLLPKASADEFERLSKTQRKSVKSLQDAISNLDLTKAREAAQQLKALQAQHIQNYMTARRIEPGVIQGIGPALVAALSIHGLRTAADFGGFDGTRFRRVGTNHWFTVSGIGPAKSFSIRYWHQSQMEAANRTIPQSLSTQQAQALETKFSALRRQNQAAIDALAPELVTIRATVDAKYKDLDRDITLKVEAVRLDFQRKRAEHDTAIAQGARQLHNLEDDKVAAELDLERYKNISFSAYLKA